MKILLMGNHVDGLVLPEGIKRYPHKCKWRVHHFSTPKDPLGRPYCTECRGMPVFFSLEEMEIEEYPIVDSYYNTVYNGRYFIVERDAINMAKVVHCKKDKYDVFIGRPSKFGNIFSHQFGTLAEHKVDTREQAIEYNKNYVYNTPWLLKEIKDKLRGKILGCFCSPLPCHGDTLLEIANAD